MNRVCVFCGSNSGARDDYAGAARELAAALVRDSLTLVYGGGRVGLMGICAGAALEAGGRVTGIIPRHLHDFEIGHHGVTDLRIVGSMHERKQMMFELSDAFAVLPGGLGTLDETFEILTWRQLGLHDKPILICDVAGSATTLLAAIEATIERGFARPEVRGLYEVTPGVESLLERLRSVAPAEGGAAALL